MRVKPPASEAELLKRTQAFAGCSLAELAHRCHLTLPENLCHAKGWVGQLFEMLLGATAGVKSAPDFEALGIELKTLPIDQEGNPQETTYICTVPLLPGHSLIWRSSNLYKKLARVLWLPIEADPIIPLAQRRVGTALLWSPSIEDECILRQDWEELMEIISLGGVENITAHQGVYLQIRPKAANAKVRRVGIGAQGEKIQTLPRGFYLRTNFTSKILRTFYI